MLHYCLQLCCPNRRLYACLLLFLWQRKSDGLMVPMHFVVTWVKALCCHHVTDMLTHHSSRFGERGRVEVILVVLLRSWNWSQVSSRWSWSRASAAPYEFGAQDAAILWLPRPTPIPQAPYGSLESLFNSCLYPTSSPLHSLTDQQPLCFHCSAASTHLSACGDVEEDVWRAHSTDFYTWTPQAALWRSRQIVYDCSQYRFNCE